MSVRQIAQEKSKTIDWAVWRRHGIGVLALVLLFGAAWYWFYPPAGATGVNMESACWRLGTICGAIWLAFWHIQRTPTWFLATLPVTLLVLWKRPIWLVVLVPLAIVVGILKPKKRRGRR